MDDFRCKSNCKYATVTAIGLTLCVDNVETKFFTTWPDKTTYLFFGVEAYMIVETIKYEYTITHDPTIMSSDV